MIDAELSKLHKELSDIYKDNALGYINPGDPQEIRRLWGQIDKLEAMLDEFEFLPVVD